MKTVKIIIVAFLAIALGSNSYAQTHDHSKMTSTKTETLKVSGNCTMCKSTIEKAAKVEGVTKADWSTKTKTLSVTFDPSKTTIDKVGKKVAGAGYDNEKMKADDKIYGSLPSCCQYR